MSKTKDRLIECLAEFAHDESWGHWMRYMFTQCVRQSSVGSMVIPSDKVERWQRQAATPYVEMPESELESDRNQAWKLLKHLAKNGYGIVALDEEAKKSVLEELKNNEPK